MRTLRTGWATRAVAGARIAAGFGRAGAARLAGDPEGDARLGDVLLRELDGLKGLGMKVGQILSALDVGLPDATVARLTALRRGVAPLAAEVVSAALEAELGAPPAALFEAFDPVPVASASVGQVHRARFGGRDVAVKVRYPGVAETLTADVSALGGLARAASVATAVDGPALVEELRRRLVEECDYALEARRTWRFREAFAGDPVLGAPEPVPERCAGGVLTTAWVSGDRLEDVPGAGPARREAVAVALARLPWACLLGHGFLHGDPHPGNFVVGAGDAPRLWVLDHGNTVEPGAAAVASFRDLAAAVLDGRRGLALDAAVACGLAPRPDRLALGSLWDVLAFLFAPYLDDRVRYDRAAWREGLRRAKRPSDPNARHLGMPPAWMWLQRTFLGVHAALATLEVAAPYRAIALAALARPSPAA